MTFDFDGARASGYSDSEIIDHVKAKPDLGFDIDAARTSGYSDAEIVDHLKARAPQPTKPAEKPSLLSRAGDAIKSVLPTRDAAMPSTAEMVAGSLSQPSAMEAEGFTVPDADAAPPAEDNQFVKGLKTGGTGAKQMLPAVATIPTIGALKSLGNELGAYDRIDSGEQVRTLGGDFIAQRARMYQNSSPETRAKLRETAVQRVGEHQEVRDALIQSWRAYAEEMKQHQGRTPNFTDIQDVSGFGDWLAFNVGQGVPYMSASALSTLVGGALGGPAGAAVGLGGSGYVMGLGDIQGELIEKGQEDKARLALAGGVPYAALDFLGPVGRTLRNVTGATLKDVASSYFKRLGREVPANLIEEFINEAGQEIVKDAAVTTATGEKMVTDDSLKRWFNAGMAGAAAAGPFAAVSAAPGPSQQTAQPMPGTRAELEAVLNDSRPLDAIRAEQAAQQREREAAAQQQAEATRESMARIAAEQAQVAAVRAQERSARNAQEFGLPAVGSRVTVGDVAGTLAAVHSGENGWDARIVTDSGEIYAFLQEDGYQVVPEAAGDGTREAPVQVEHAAHIEQAAQQVETHPTEAQKEAGNYSKAHVKLHGLDISIENPKGSERSGTGPDGKPWSVQMPAAYGYVKRSEGADGDQVDVYLGDNPQSERVFVVDQIDPATGRFDEHKVMLGFDQPSEAVKTYQAGFSDGSGLRRIGAVTETSVADFKDWLHNADTRKPVAYKERQTDPVTSQEPAAGERQADVKTAEAVTPETPKSRQPKPEYEKTAAEWHRDHIEWLVDRYGYRGKDAVEARSAPVDWQAHQDFLEARLENGGEIPQRILDDYRKHGITPSKEDWPRLAKLLPGDTKVNAEQPLKALEKGQASRLAAHMTKQGFPSKAIPHPSIAGKYAVVEESYQEQRSVQPVAESQAPAPSEPGDGEVATAWTGAAPDGKKKRGRPEPTTLLDVIRRKYGGINSSYAMDLTGEAPFRANQKYRGLFSSTGEGLDELARRLAEQDHFPIDLEAGNDNGGVNQLHELIRRAFAGERIVSVERDEAEQAGELETAQRKEIREKAKELGVKTVARKFEDVERDVLDRLTAIDEEREAQLDGEAALAYETAYNELLAVLRESDDVNAEVDRLRSQYAEQSLRQYLNAAAEMMRQWRDRVVAYRELTPEAREAELDAIFGESHAATAETAEGNEPRGIQAPTGDSRQGAGQTDAGAAGPADGQAYARPGAEDGGPAGEAARPEFGLETQTREDLAESERRQQDAEAQRTREEQEAEARRQADAERGTFALTGSDRPADVLAAQGQTGLFEAQPEQSSKPSKTSGQFAGTVRSLQEAESALVGKPAGTWVLRVEGSGDLLSKERKMYYNVSYSVGDGTWAGGDTQNSEAAAFESARHGAAERFDIQLSPRATTNSSEIGSSSVDEKVSPSETAKEPWQMTRDEYVRGNGFELSPHAKLYGLKESPWQADDVSRATMTHKFQHVQPAIDAGKPVPAEVLADYPDLKPASVKDSLKTDQAGLAATGKIEDFGEKITGARKDYAAVLSEAREADVASVPLSKSWPEPDYQKLLDGGADRWAVAFMHAARDEIPTKPQQPWKLRSWVGKVEMLRDTAAKMLSGEIDSARAKEMLRDDKWKSLRDVESRIDLYIEVGHEKSLKGIRIAAGDYGVFGGQQYSPPKRIWTVEAKAAKTAMSHWPKTLASGDTREEAIAAFKTAWLKTSEETKADARIDFGIYSRAGKFFVGKKIGSHVVELKSGFESAKEARAWKDSNQDELVGILEKFKEVPAERKAENSPRVGADHRGGADVTPDRFMETFGFRGVQFGNYVENDRRQADLNETYDALMDLAGVLEVPPKALSLNGELGLAFGARGTGGKNAPSAHYEPGQVVINLTKKRGAGSLAHEWFHAADNYFSRMAGAKDGFLTEAQSAGEGVRPEMIAAFRLTMRAINSTALKARSQKLDQTRAKPYWSTGLEMAARAFESYVVAKLQDQGASNDYLANIVTEDYWNAAAALGMEKEDTYPYPVAAEVPEIRAAFDNFFNTVETRETDKGVALFSRSNLADRIDAVLRGEKTDQPIYLGETPAVLQRLGMKPLPTAMSPENASKAVFDHGMLSREMKVLADAIADPVAVVESDSVRAPEGAMVVITDLVKSDGRPVIVAVHPGMELWRVQTNEVKSVYPKENTDAVTRWLENKLRYVSNEKRPEWQRFTGVQFPKKVPQRSASGHIILTDRDIVKADRQAVWGNDPFSKETGAFSRRDLTGADTKLTTLFTLIADQDGVFKYPKSDAKDMAEIAAEVDPTLYVDDQGKSALTDRYHYWTVAMQDGTQAVVQTDEDRKEVWVNAGLLEQGRSRGSALYALVGTWAHNNGYVFIGDPGGVSNTAVYRRTENMISLALKFGTTDFLRPHEDQLQAVDWKRHGEHFYWPGMQWRDGDTEFNLNQMLEASYNAVAHHVPEIRQLRFDTDAGVFVDAGTGTRVADSRFTQLARTQGARRAHAGVAGLKRAVLAQLVLSGELSRPDAWRQALGQLVEQRGAPADSGLEGILYRKSDGRDQGAGALDTRAVEAVVAAIRDGWRNSPRISVVESVADLPFDAPADVEGAYWRGQIWLVAENQANPARVKFTVFHEGLGHYGLRGFFGNDLDDILQRLWAANPQVRQRAAKWLHANQDVIADQKLSKKDAHYLAIEEALADMAGEGHKITGLKKLVAAVQEWLRSHGFAEVADWLESKTDAEVLRVLADAKAFVEEGRQYAGSAEMEPAYHRAFHGGPQDFEEFSTEHIGSGEGAQAYGWGLYFAGQKEVADFYRKKLSGDGISLSRFTKDGQVLNGREALREYFKPGRRVNGYAGIDEVLEFLEKDGWNWAVKVKSVEDQFGKKPNYYDSQPRWHSTEPSAKEVEKVLSAEGWKRESGRLYEVELSPREDEYLDWDRPLSEQSESVKEKLTTSPVIEKWATSAWEKNGLRGTPTGSSLYETLTEKLGDQKQASETLRSIGIRGIRYLDGSSRHANVIDKKLDALLSKHNGDADAAVDEFMRSVHEAPGAKAKMRASFLEKIKSRNYNYVVFDDKDVRITAKFSRAAKESTDEASADLKSDAGVPSTPEANNLFGADRPLPKDINLFKRLALHPRMIAAMDADFTPVFQTASDQFERRDEIAAEIQREAQAYFDLPRAGKERVNAVLELGRLQGEVFGRGKEPVVAENTGQAAQLSKPGDTIELTDAEKSGYWGVRRAMDKALNIFRDQFLRENGMPASVKSAADVLALIEDGMSDAAAKKLQQIAAVIREIEQARRTGYVPFTRWGKVGIVVEAVKAGQKETLHFEKVELDSVAGKIERAFLNDKRRLGNVKEVRARLAALEGKYPGADIRLVNLADPKEAATVDMAALDHLAQLAQVDETTWDAVKEQLDKARQAAGFRRHFFGSRNIPGYSTDFERAIADYVVGISGYLARREYSPRWDAAIEGIAPTKPQLIRYANDYRKYANTPTEELSALRQTVFFYYLSGVPATAMVNMTQVPLITAPYLTQFANPVQVTNALSRAYKDGLAMLTTRKGLDIFDPAKAPEDVRAAFQHAWDQGFFVPLQTYEMMGLAQNRSKVMRSLSSKTRTAMEVVSLQFTMAERLNRIVTFIAAYRMATREGFGEHAQQVMRDNALAQSELGNFSPEAFAEWVIDETHYRMGKVNRPAVMRGVGTAILQFKSFTWQTLELYSRLATMHGREGQVALGLMMLALLLVTGLWGLPGAEDLRDLFEGVYKKLTGQDKDVKTAMRAAIAEATGSAKIAELIAHGAPRAIDGMPEISRRLGMGNILPSPNEDVLGVPVDLTVKRLSRAIEYQQRGQTLLASAEMMPNFVKHPMTAWAWSREGVKSAATGRTIIPPEKLKTRDLAEKAIGFTPADVAEYREMETAKRRAEHGGDEQRRDWYAKVAATRAEIYRAEQRGDRDAARAAEDKLMAHYREIQRHNEQAKPEDVIRLDPKTVQKKTAEEILGAEARRKQVRKQARGRAQEIEKAYGF